MKPTTFALAVLAALAAAPATAAAKAPIDASICGDDGCVRVEDERDLNVLVNGGPPQDPPIRPAAFYRIHMTFGDARPGGLRESWTTFYVPSREMLGGDGPFGGLVWWPADRAERRLLDGVTASLTPFAAPHVTAVRVSDRTVRGGDLSAWLALYGGLEPAGDDLPPGPWYSLEWPTGARPGPTGG